VSEVEDENDFRISDTLRYLKNRESRGEKKEVDRKASKNRKLRFNVHAKLLNFMPAQSSREIEARDEIVENIFNCKAAANSTVKTRQDEETYYIDI
jgi:protein AATF/BFR2